MSDILAYEYQLEEDFINLIKAELTANSTFDAAIVSRAGKVGKKQSYPAVFVEAKNVDDAFLLGSGNSGVMQGDIMIDVCTYGADDKDGSIQKSLLSDVRKGVFVTDLKNKLNALSNYTYFGVIIGASFSEPGDRIRKMVIQIDVKFSPTK